MRFSRAVVALSLALLLGSVVGAPATEADPTGADPRSERAQQVLSAVETLLDGDHLVRADAHDDARSLTIALRDLRLLLDALPADARERAEQILMRPGQPGDDHVPTRLPRVRCAETVCVHYTERGNHAPRGADGDAATTPRYIARVRDAVQRIHNTYVAAGYRRPKPDGAIGGGTDKVDIYVGDIGDDGLYGYCTSDDPNDPDVSGDRSLWAYCTLDDDYAPSEFPFNTPLENMRVTAAHEYFHAVQYAYDAWEDGWILESTATWVEDEMYDGVNDNRHYLRDSPLTKPGRSMDRFGGLFHYGTWIWWRYLTERYDDESGRLPRLVLDVWRLLDGTAGAPNLYSTQGLARVLRRHDTRLKRQVLLFAAANRRPATAYEEGAAPAYRTAPPAATLVLGPGAVDPAPVRLRRDHLTSATVRLDPRDTDARGWRLRLALDLPRPERGSAAVVLAYRKGGGVTRTVVALDRDGSGRATVPFSTQAVRRVEVVLVSASVRYRCQQGTAFACAGDPVDDDLRFSVDARAFRS